MTRTPYTTVADVENYLLKDINTSFEGNISKWILAVSAEMDRMANRKLVADTYGAEEELELKYFDVEQVGYVTVDDFVDISSVQQKEGDTWTDRDFEPYPALPPSRKIIGSFSYGLQSIRVRAQWGLFHPDSIPEDLQHACTVLVSGVCLANQSAGGVSAMPISREKIGNYDVAYATGDAAGKAGGYQDIASALDVIQGYRRLAI